ncbi:ABC-three component system protein [Pseudoflavonifractor phocaeensis]|uniref:ABC-three component system protein n=1 Tax=Pseudoflavonifractor phocaeensis TaxID=1870988 RepID=UPI00210D3C3D|nr:ABC-three component system protein [Pseudoflavonifractor phocaeensis]MCQ4863888.1 hypothetical protein [Pseudoflavonifractor phocaeensis]
MSLSNLGFPYDATNSWNGYNHQGKIALWFAINQIVDLWDKTKSKDGNMEVLQEYHLELEYLEDFSIVHFCSGTKKYLSIHQVKSREDTSIVAYQEAILNLIIKLINYPSIEYAYLHVTKRLNLGDKSFSDNVIQIATKSNKIDEICKDIEEHREDEAFRKQFYTVKRGAPSNQKKAVLEALRQFNPNETKITADNIDIAFQSFLDQSKASIEQLHKKGTAQVKKVILSEYSGIVDGAGKQDYCGADQAEKLLMVAICRYFEMTEATSYHAHDKEYQKKVYLFLLGQLDKHIIDRQVNAANYRSSAKERAISFRTIIKWLETDCSTMGKEFYLSHIKEEYFKKMDGFCAGCRKKSLACSKCHIISAKNKIGEMAFEKFEKFAFVTSPDVIGSMNMDSYASFAGTSGLTDPFSKGLRDLPVPFADAPDMLPVAYIDSAKKQFALTTITGEGRDDDTENICTEILKNRNVYSLMMDCDALISKDVQSDSIQGDAQDITEWGDTELEESAEHIAHCKKVVIVRLDDCKEKFLKECDQV